MAYIRSQPVKPQVVHFMGKIEWDKHPKTVVNSKSSEQMHVGKLWEQQGIKTISKQPSTVARIPAFEAQLRVNSQSEEGDIVKKVERLKQIQHGGETERILW